MKEQDFWILVRVNTPYGKYHSAFITCNCYDYNEESTLEEGPEVAKLKLFAHLKSLGHLLQDNDF